MTASNISQKFTARGHNQLRDTYMRKGFTLIELLIIVVIIAILGLVAFDKLKGTTRTDSNGNTVEVTMTTEVLCPLNTVDSVRDTVPLVVRYDYLRNELRLWLGATAGRRYKSYPSTCVVRELNTGF